MKKIILAITLCLLLISPSLIYAAGSCTQTPYQLSSGIVKVVFLCTGDAVDGSIPNTAIDTATSTLLVGNYYLYTVSAYPTAGGPAPDAADVFILDASGEDLLGSVDGGTTANKGANLIHATLKKTTWPYSHYLSLHYFPSVLNALTLKVSNQATAGAKYTIELIFVR